MSCEVNIKGKNFDIQEAVSFFLKSPDSFDDIVLTSTETDNFITGVPLRHQLDLADYMVNEMLNTEGILNDFKPGEKETWTKKKVLEKLQKRGEVVKDKLQKISEAVDAIENPNEKQVTLKRYADEVLRNFDIIENLSMRIFISKDIFTIGKGDIDALLASLDENDFRNFDEDFTFERDVRDSMSVRLKFFLAHIPKTSPDGSPRQSLLGRFPIYRDMNEVYAEVRNSLTNLKPDWEVMRAEMEKKSKHKPYYTEIIERLEKPENSHLRNEFVSMMSSHPIKMIFIKFKQVANSKGEATYTPIIGDSNRNTITNVLLESWESKVLENTNLFYLDSETGSYKVRGFEEGKGSYIIDELFKKYNDKEQYTKADFKAFFKDLGVEVEDATVDEISTNGMYIGNIKVHIPEFFTGKLGFHKIMDSLRLMSQDNLPFDDKNIFNSAYGGNIFRSLAKIDALHTDNIYLSSFRTGDKSIASHSFNRYAISKLRDLKNDPELRKKLSKIPFIGTNPLLKMMEDPTLNAEMELVYPDAASFMVQDGQDNKELREFNAAEHLMAMAILFTNNGVTVTAADKKEYRSVRMMYLTMSDKKNRYVFQQPMEIINNYKLVNPDGSFQDGVVDYIYNKVFLAEANRIKNEQSISERNIKGYNEGRLKFLIFDELNSNNEASKNALYIFENGKYILNPVFDQTPEAVNYIKEVIQSKLNEELNSLRDLFKDHDIKVPDKYTEKIAKEKSLGANATEEQIFNSFTADFVATSIISNMNVMQLISGDPAFAWKKNEITTWDNYAKRLAKDNAPGLEIDNTGNPNFKVLFAQDKVIESEFLDYFSKFSDGYDNIQSTDAQSLIAMDEWAHILYRKGAISLNDYNTILDSYKNDKDLSPELLSRLTNVFKPVYVGDHYENGIERKLYIKMSSYPLIPQMTKGMEIDKVRQLMKDKGIQMIAFDSGTKLGAPIQQADLFADDITFDESQVLDLKREGFKLQQEIPTKQANEVNRGTQFTKLIFNNFRHIKDIVALEKEHDEKYNKLFQIKKDKLEKEILTENGDVNFDVLNKIIKEELIERKYDNGTLAYFAKEDKDFAYPFWANPQKNRIEAIINALIDTRIRKLKFPGKSYVLASNAGYKTTVTSLEDYKGKLIFTSNYEFGKDLKPQTFIGGKVQRAQVIVPWNFKDAEGKLLDIRKFMTDGMIDFNKIPEKLLQIQGFRIPTQGHNSMSAIEIVGFLPPGVTDIVIAPAEYVTQMGSDFDVDKLYSYMYHNEVTRDGKLALISEEFSDPKRIDNLDEKLLINDIIDIQDKVLTYPDKEVQEAIGKKLDYGLFDESNDKRNPIKDIQVKRDSAKKNMFIGPLKQLENYIGASSAKDAVGAYSLASTFNSLIQGKQFEINFLPDSSRISLNDLLTFGNLTANANLGAEEVLGSNRKKSEVISAIQSAAVDNENQRILEKIGVFAETLNIPPSMAQLGFDEYHISTLLMNDLVLKNSHLFDLSPAKFEEAFDKLYYENFPQKDLVQRNEDNKKKLYQINEGFFQGVPQDELLKLKTKIEKEIKEFEESDVLNEYESQFRQALLAPFSDYFEAINNPNAPNYETLNLAAVYKLYMFNRLGKKLRNYQLLTNMDSAGLKKNFYEAIIFNYSFKELLDTRDPIIDILGETSNMPQEGFHFVSEDFYYKPTKLASILYFNESDFIVSNLYSDQRLSLYGTKAFVQALNEFLAIRNGINQRDVTTSMLLQFSKSKYLRDFESSLIKYIMSYNESLFNGDFTGHRQRLMGANTGLHTTLSKLQDALKGVKSTNNFIKALEVQTTEDDLGDKVQRIVYRASKSHDDFDNKLMTDFENLYSIDENLPGIEMTGKEFALDLIRYNFINDPLQGATNFSRFIPVKILKEIGVVDTLKSFNFNDESVIGHNGNFISDFNRQFIQNNALLIPSLPLNAETLKSQSPEILVTTGGIKIFPKDAQTGNIKFIVRSGEVLFQSTGRRFVKIPKLSNEYNINQSMIHNSVIRKDKLKPFEYEVQGKMGQKNIKTVYRDRLSKAIDKGSVEDVLTEIMNNSQNEHYRNLASEFLNHPVLDRVELSYGNVPFGRTSYFDNFNLVTVNKSKFSLEGIRRQEEVLLHELTHVFTKRGVKLFENKSPDLTEAQKKSFNRLQYAFNMYKKTFDSKDLKALEDKLKKHKAGDKQTFSAYEQLLYTAINFEEFIAGVFTNVEAKNHLKKISLAKNKDKTLWEKIKDLIFDVLKAFGITERHQIPNAVVNEIMEVIKQETEVVLPPQFNSTSRIMNITPDNPILKIC